MKHFQRREYYLSLLDALTSRVVAVSGMFLFTIAYLGSYTIHQVAIDDVQRNLVREAAHVNAGLDAKFNELRVSATHVSNDPSLKDAIARVPAAQQHLSAQLNAMLINGKKPRRIGIVDWREQVIASSGSAESLLSDKWIGSSLSGREFVEFSIQGMKLSLPIKSDGNIIGSVFIEISREDAGAFFSVDPSYGDVVILYKNYPIAFTNSAIYLESLDKSNFSSDTITHRTAGEKFGELEVLVAIRQSVAIVEAYSISLVVWFLAVISFVSIYCATVYIANATRRKSNELSDEIDTFESAQDLQRTVDVDADFGLSVAIKSLNEMLERLRGNVVSIDVLNEGDENRRRAEQEVQDNEAKTQTILNAVSEGIITVDNGGIVRSLNPAAAEIFGCSDVDGAVGTHLGAFIPDAARFFSNVGAVALPDDGQSNIPEALTEHIGLREDTTTFPLELSFSKMQLAGRVMFTGIVRNISERKQSEQKMIEMAYRDHLTGLLNRRSYPEEVDKLIEKAREQGKLLAVFMLDLDRFKDVNDCLGHRVGDDLLRLVAHKLQTVTGKKDLLARLGGDEFAVAAICSSESEADDLANEILAATNSKVSISGFDVHLRTSIGVSLFPDDTTSPNELLRNSDLALYRAKSSGRGTRSFFTKEMANEIEWKSRLERDLRSAISEENLEIHFQPQFDLKSSRLVGAEALVRWNHPEHGAVSPAKFIPLAEERGLISQIGKMVLLESCIQGAKWSNVGISVNLSPAQFIYDDIVGLVSHAIRQSGIAPDKLTLEITEGLFLKDDKMISQQLFDLKMLGVNLSLDDFGTGYSSLGYLTRLPIDEIKIDKSFVSQINLKKGEEIVKGLVRLSQSLGLTLVAEGVETTRQLQFLAEIDCDICQGFLMGKPVCPADFEETYIAACKTRVA